MEKLTLKREIAGICKQIKLESETNLLIAVREAEQSANEYGQPRDRYDSYRAQLSNKRDMLAQQLRKVQDEIALLDRIDLNRECDAAGFGSVVITSLQQVFISIGIGKVKLDTGEVFYAISAAVPFAMAVHGMKKGDTFGFKGLRHQIIDVY